MGKKTESLSVNYLPVGAFFETEEGYFFAASKTKRYHLISKRALDSWSPQRVLKASEHDPAVKALKNTAKMKFRNGSLIWNLADGKVYLIESGKRRWVKNPDYLNLFGVKDWGLSLGPVVPVSDTELKLHEPGDDLN